MTSKKRYPIRAYFENQGYNYIVGSGKLLFEGVLFKDATKFDKTGHAEVEMSSGERKTIDRYGNFC